jgi:hypothetical protein
MIKDLIKIADKLDSAGFFREADQIDWVVNRLVIQSNILKEASSVEELTEDPDGFGVNPEPSRETTQQEWDEMGQMEMPHSYEEPFDSEYIKKMISKMSPEQKEDIMSNLISSIDEDGF